MTVRKLPQPEMSPHLKKTIEHFFKDAMADRVRALGLVYIDTDGETIMGFDAESCDVLRIVGALEALKMGIISNNVVEK